MSREKEINELVKGFPEEVCGEFRYWNLQRKYGYNKITQLMGYEAIELNSEMTILIEYGTLLLYGVLTLENMYLVDFVDGQYVVVDEIDSVQWMDEKINILKCEWDKYMNGGKDNE